MWLILEHLLHKVMFIAIYALAIFREISYSYYIYNDSCFEKNLGGVWKPGYFNL